MTSSANEPGRPWATVTDSQSTTWPLRITLAQARDLRANRKVDLLATDAAKTATQVAGDPIALCEIAYDISAAQRATLGIATEDAFLGRFDGDSFADLFDATVEAMVDFFPPGRREALKAVWLRQRMATARAERQVTESIAKPGMLDAIDRATTKALEEFDQKLSELGAIRS
jgi:hypothetical protein